MIYFSPHRIPQPEGTRRAPAKWAFTTRRVPWNAVHTLLTGDLCPQAGQLVLARVTEIGAHTRIELANGRRATLYLDDELVLAYGNRYAPDQFEGVVPPDLGPCQLIAAGGLAGRELVRHETMDDPTQIEPVGVLGDATGTPLNLKDFALPAVTPTGRRLPVLMVCGTSMNSGKTHAVAHLIRGLTALGRRVGGLKVTGTGAGGDLWRMADAGAVATLDFTDAGYGSTYGVPLEALRRVLALLLDTVARENVDIVVMEVADGLVQAETAALLADPGFSACVDGVVFCATDALGAGAGLARLTELNLRPLAISGMLTRAPLMVREAASLVQVPIMGPEALSTPDRLVALLPWLRSTDGPVSSQAYGAATPTAVAL